MKKQNADKLKDLLGQLHESGIEVKNIGSSNQGANLTNASAISKAMIDKIGTATKDFGAWVAWTMSF